MDRRQNNGSVKAVSPRHCTATCALQQLLFQLLCLDSHKDNVRCTAVDEQLGQLEAKEVNLLSPAPPPYSWSLLGKLEGSAPPPSSKIFWSFDLAWNPTFPEDLLSCCLTSTEARWPIRDGDRVGRGRESERLDRGNRPKKTGETADRR